jgi:uncharacterized protein (DUF2126 family)/transglutaminase-like putative cysteine protease
MSIHIALSHITHYRYDREVALGPQLVRLRPAPHCRTRILSYSMRVEPAKHFINWQQDPQANYMARLVFPERTREFRVEVDVIAEMAVFNPFDFFLSPGAEHIPFQYEATEATELAPYLQRARPTPLFERYLAKVPRDKKPTMDFLVALNQQLSQDVRYLIRMEPGVQTPEQTLERSAGSCRDSSWLLVQVLRHLGLAARFVSGYLIQLTADIKSLDGPSGPPADFTDLHAWCEVYLPGAGWIGLDPTSGLMAGEGHIPLACTPEPTSAAPITGAVDECEVQFEHHMSVARVWEAPRVTKPYTEEQWQAIDSLGEAIDADLKQADVRLTMGGEPTFVSLDDPDGDEWNTTAMGPNKRALASDLFHKLRAHYAPQGLVHFGQGKWYPGEQLPRWSLNCFWRRDGEPIWRDPALIADESVDHAVTPLMAQRFVRGVAERLGLDPRHVFAGFEDVFYYLWRERRLPVNVDPFDSRLDDKQERARLSRVFTQGLDRIAGYVLPIARDAGATRWQTGAWFLRAERCYLTPGDSAMGFRLPLDSQPWTTRSDYPYIHVPDQTQAFPPLARYAQVRQQLREAPPRVATEAPSSAADARIVDGRVEGRPADGRRAADAALASRAPVARESASWINRTALCAEPRDGVLYIFMPPLARAEDYLELVTAVEATSAAMGVPVLLEGYEPPRDPRLNQFRITPDPGVIEANMQPSSDWKELSERTTFLYNAARECRLGTEKFMLDGRHTGTGGGNHFVLGGATVPDSPFLRRPDVLASLLSYWHNHPSLSYLFSGLFVGPTSQAPRVDEARNDSLYELELAIQQMPAPGKDVPPWLVDRLLRNLLIDVTGNTHRSEFCIDKLYSPDGPAGRLGLLELRAFEMPPHHRMSLTQQLLLRSLVARFWKQPYQPGRLTRWGTELHDRFMLPYFVEADFRDVLSEQKTAGYALEQAWFAPHFEFRFPKYGDFATMGIEMELRHALEPWHVMGEEGAAGSTVRYVDSSIERLQVKVTGLAPDRYALSCNGRRVPLRPTGRVGEFVAGVRYRAWQPPSALHPRIGVHSPLTFDLVDLWMKRSLGGCQYHVAHPGGLSYGRMPVNSFEAESRRLSRFFRIGHTPATDAAAAGASFAAAERPDTEFPFTLDLRRAPVY